MSSANAHHVVVVGGGFGGLHLVRRLRHAPVRITLIDRRNFHLFQPLLYQVATGELSAPNIAATLREVLKRQENVEVVLDEVVGFDAERRVVKTRREEINYDTLVVATGAHHHYFGNDQWEAIAPGLKTLEDAMQMRRRILLAFERAEREQDPDLRDAWLTFVLVGGGPTGVELAGAIGELARRTLKRNFRHYEPSTARILLVEGEDRLIPPFPPELSQKAAQSLERLGVTVRLSARVIDVQPDHVVIRDASGEETVRTHTVLWSAGVKASPLGKALADAVGAEVDRAGRVVVEADCSVPGHPEVFVIGDLANYTHGTERPLPGVASVAIQQGNYVAKRIAKRQAGNDAGPFSYFDRGSLATIGRAAAVAHIRGLTLSGYPAWLVWLLVHLGYLVGFQNRLMVLFQWAGNYFTTSRDARVITGRDYLPIDEHIAGEAVTVARHEPGD